MALKEFYLAKKKAYFCNTRKELAEMVEGNDNKILEIGCGTGETGDYLKKSGKASEVRGVELLESIGNEAKHKIDHVIIGNVETLTLDFPKEYFDYIILGDILEHLNNPWSVLKNPKLYLKTDGHVIASIPNVKYIWVAVGLLLKDDWQYEEEGILDITHLRFFTKKTMKKLFFKAELEIVEMKPNLCPWGPKSKFINAITLGIFKDFFALQYHIKAKKQ